MLYSPDHQPRTTQNEESRRTSVICSATKGETDDLNAPVPIPMTTMAITKQPSDPFGLTMTEGIAAMMRRMCPTMAIPVA